MPLAFLQFYTLASPSIEGLTLLLVIPTSPQVLLDPLAPLALPDPTTVNDEDSKEFDLEEDLMEVKGIDDDCSSLN